MTTIRATELSDVDNVKIRNLVGYPVIIVTPIHHKRWELPPHGEMEVTVADVRECSYDQGCRNIFHDYVQICNSELAKEFGVNDDVDHIGGFQTNAQRVVDHRGVGGRRVIHR